MIVLCCGACRVLAQHGSASRRPAQIVFAQVPDPVGGGFVTNQSS